MWMCCLVLVGVFVVVGCCGWFVVRGGFFFVCLCALFRVFCVWFIGVWVLGGGGMVGWFVLRLRCGVFVFGFLVFFAGVFGYFSVCFVFVVLGCFIGCFLLCFFGVWIVLGLFVFFICVVERGYVWVFVRVVLVLVC